MRKIINSNYAPDPVGPYNQAIMFDNTIYLSGQIALDPLTMTMKNDSIESETKQVFKNISEVLKEAKYDFNNVVKITISLSDMNNFQAVNKLYSSYFEKGNEPARETVEVSALPKGAKIEISVIAKK